MKLLPGIALLVLWHGGAAVAASERLVVMPVTTIYPGDTIRAAQVTEDYVRDPPPAVAQASGDVIGRLARRTLLPGRAIPLDALDAPPLILNGAVVGVAFEQPGLSITSKAQSLQAGRVGETIRVRNTESGIVVSGVVLPDGTVRVGP